MTGKLSVSAVNSGFTNWELHRRRQTNALVRMNQRMQLDKRHTISRMLLRLFVETRKQ